MNKLRMLWDRLSDALSRTFDADMGGMLSGRKSRTSPPRHLVITLGQMARMPAWWRSDLRRLVDEMETITGDNAFTHEYQILKRNKRGRFKTLDLPKL